jgi:hypothetical protein
MTINSQGYSSKILKCQSETVHRILADTNLSISEKMMCIVLCMNSGSEKECSLTTSYLAEQMSCCIRNVQRTTKDLIEKGYLFREAQYVEVEGRAQTANRYILLLG